MKKYCFAFGFITAVFAGLLVIDVLTTTVILKLGGTELNPLMSGIADHPWVHLMIKTIFATFVVLVAVLGRALKEALRCIDPYRRMLDIFLGPNSKY